MTSLQTPQMEKLLEQLHAIEQKAEDAKREVEEHKQAMVRVCPVQVGDEVACNGYSYRGKIMVVDKVVFNRYFGNKYRFEAIGRVKKKDGSLGERTGEWRSEMIEGVSHKSGGDA